MREPLHALRWGRRAVALIAAGSLLALSAGAAGATSDRSHHAVIGRIGIRLVDVPVTGQNDPRASLYIVDHLAPGATIERRIEVANLNTSPAHVRLYAASATIEDGAFIGAAAHTPDELSTWTSIDLHAPVLAPRARQVATVTITVPIDAAPGERYAVVWAETRSTPSGGGVTRVNRVGIRLYVDIGPGGAPAADFTIDSLTAMRSPQGAPMVVATVHNIGGRALDMSGTLELLGGPGGLSAGPFPANLGVTLGIGDTEPVTIALDGQLPDGPWDARIVLHSGLVERVAHAVITFPNAGAAPAVKTGSNLPMGLFVAIAALTLVLIAIVAFLAGRKRQRRSPAPVTT